MIVVFVDRNVDKMSTLPTAKLTSIVVYIDPGEVVGKQKGITNLDVTRQLLPSNVSQCTSTTDSQELALNCTVHKILLTVFTINQLIHYYLTAIVISCQSLSYSLTESGKSVCKCERTIDLNHAL